MVRIRSYTAGEAELARWLGTELQGRGLEVELQEIAPDRLNTLAWLRGAAGGANLMLNGHLDTNPAGEGWTKDPFGGEIADGCVYGIGVSNMKAADAAMIEAATAVREAAVPVRGDVCLALVAGELQGGVGTLHLLERGVRTDHFVVGEPTDLSVVTLHAGSFDFAVNVIGRTRHLSKMDEGISAIDKMYEVIRELGRVRFSGAERTDHRGLQRLNVGVIRGGMTREYLEWRVPQVPDFCTIKVAGRIAPSQTPEGALADIERALRALQERDRDLRFEIVPSGTPGKHVMPPFEVDRDHPFVRRLVALHEEIVGAPPRVGDIAPYKFYGTDAGHLAARGMIGAVYGPGGKFNTMADERVEIADLVAAAKVYALLVAEICGT